eukprot:jgi/Hompol1/5317/HPOL_000761-RA
MSTVSKVQTDISDASTAPSLPPKAATLRSSIDLELKLPFDRQPSERPSQHFRALVQPTFHQVVRDQAEAQVKDENERAEAERQRLALLQQAQEAENARRIAAAAAMQEAAAREQQQHELYWQQQEQRGGVAPHSSARTGAQNSGAQSGGFFSGLASVLPTWRRSQPRPQPQQQQQQQQQNQSFYYQQDPHQQQDSTDFQPSTPLTPVAASSFAQQQQGSADSVVQPARAISSSGFYSQASPPSTVPTAPFTTILPDSSFVGSAKPPQAGSVLSTSSASVSPIDDVAPILQYRYWMCIAVMIPAIVAFSISTTLIRMYHRYAADDVFASMQFFAVTSGATWITALLHLIWFIARNLSLPLSPFALLLTSKPFGAACDIGSWAVLLLFWIATTVDTGLRSTSCHGFRAFGGVVPESACTAIVASNWFGVIAGAASASVLVVKIIEFRKNGMFAELRQILNALSSAVAER